MLMFFCFVLFCFVFCLFFVFCFLFYSTVKFEFVNIDSQLFGYEIHVNLSRGRFFSYSGSLICSKRLEPQRVGSNQVEALCQDVWPLLRTKELEYF